MLKQIIVLISFISISIALESILLSDTFIDSENTTTNFGNKPFVLSSDESQYAFFKFQTPPYSTLQSANLVLTLCDVSTCGSDFPQKLATELYIYVFTKTWSESTITFDSQTPEANTFYELGLGSFNIDSAQPGETISIPLAVDPRIAFDLDLSQFSNDVYLSIYVLSDDDVSFQSKESIGGKRAVLNYTISPTPTTNTDSHGFSYTYSDSCVAQFITPNTLTLIVPAGVDEYQDSFALPFNFTFWNQTHFAGTEIFPCSNGQLNFGSDCYYDIADINTESASHIVIFGRDLGTVTNGISYGVSGTAPNRVLVVDYNTNLLGQPWNVVNHYQIQIVETTNQIRFVYNSMPYAQTAIFIRDPANQLNDFFYTVGNSTVPNGNFSICWQQGPPTTGRTPSTPTAPPSPLPTKVGPDASNNRFFDSNNTECVNDWIEINETSLATPIATIALPFDFKFYNQTYQSGHLISTCQFGHISFSPNGTSCDESILSPGLEGFGHIGFANYLAGSYFSTDGVVFGSVGDSPNRTLVINWKIRTWSPWWVANFQLALIEGTNDFKWNVDYLSSGPWKYTVHIQNPQNSSDFLTYARNAKIDAFRATPFSICSSSAVVPTPQPTPIPTPQPTPEPTPAPTTIANTETTSEEDSASDGFRLMSNQVFVFVSLILISIVFI